ncbi:MAG: antibiotic biosynthesis monooxygenase [Acidobacteriota bacterium]
MTTASAPRPDEDESPGEVVRVWRAATTPERVAHYRNHLRTQVEPALLALDGFIGLSLLTRPLDALVEIVVMTRWRSIAAIAAFAGLDLDVAVVEPAARAVLTEHDTIARHFVVAYERAND